MIYTIRGKVIAFGDAFAVVECGGVGFRIFTNKITLQDLGRKTEEALFYCFLYMKETELELYGFLEERTLKLFEMLNSVSGIGPKNAMHILSSIEIGE